MDIQARICKPLKALAPLLALVFVGQAGATEEDSFFSSYEGVTSQRDCFAAPFDTADNVRAILDEFSSFPQRVLDNLFSERFFAMRQQQNDCLRFSYEVDGVDVDGFMLRAKDAPDDSPVLVYHRGGNGDYGSVNFVMLYNRFMGMTEHGYTIIGSNLRREDEFGGADVKDSRAILSIVAGMDNVDHERVALWGESRGASQMMQVAKGRDDIHALVFAVGSADHEQSLVTRPEMLQVYQHRVPDFAANREEELRKRSAIHWLDDIPEVPILILHGEQDEQVNVEQAHILAAGLDESGHKYELKIYPDQGHNLRGEAITDKFNWLDTVLDR